jgi:hypothetical protein
MSAHDGAVSVMAAGTTVNADNPWPGLLAFREGDEGYFQGRQAETEDLSRLVLRERLIVLFGLSGLGKSSLLQAGLFPKIRPKGVFPVYIRLDYSAEKPELTAQVIAAITREAGAHQVEAPAGRNGETLWEYFHREGNNFWNSRNRPVMPLLVFDQFEEAFTLGRLDAQRSAATDAFLAELADLAETRPPATLKDRIDQHPDEAGAFDFARHHYKILLGIREDFLPDLETLRASMPTLALNRMRLQRMNGEAALLVVNQAEHLIDPDVGEQVVRFVAADKDRRALEELEVEPALLSVVCRELNIRRRNEGKAKISTDLLKGNQEQVLADFYERSTADLAPEVRPFVEDKLLTVSGYRDSVALENALSTPGVSRNDIETLVERRLIRREDRGGTQRLELTHDLLAGVVRASRDSRRQREATEQAQIALLQTQAKLRRSRLLIGAFALLTLLAAGAAGWALWEQGQANTKAVEAADNAVAARAAEAIAKNNKATAEGNARRAIEGESLATANSVRAQKAEKRAREEAQRAVLAENNAKESALLAEENRKEADRNRTNAEENAALNERLNYQFTDGIRNAANSTDLKQVQTLLGSTLKDVKDYEAMYYKAGRQESSSDELGPDTTMVKRNREEIGRHQATFTPVCPLPFQGLRNPLSDDYCGIQGGNSNPALQAQSTAMNNFCATTEHPETITYQDLLNWQTRSAHFPTRMSDRKEVENLGEGKYVSYIAFIKEAHYADTVAGEAVNCNRSGYNTNDIHITLISDPNNTDLCQSTIAEISPHYRPVSWRPGLLNELGKPVRIRGQLFYDGSHRPCSGKARPNPKRASVWEIHPVYSIDVCRMTDLKACQDSTNPADWTPVE